MNCRDCGIVLDTKIGYYQDDINGNLFCFSCGDKYPDTVSTEEKIPKVFPRIGALDPGRMKDSFAMVGIQVENKSHIRIVGATQWKKQEYDTVEKQVHIIHSSVVKRPFDIIGVETNQVGWHVVEALRKLQLPILPVNTVGKITDPKKLKIPKSMFKNDTVEWVQRMNQVGLILFPTKDSVGTLALKNQIPKFTRKLSPSGQVTYSAQGTEHDDLVMAFIIACHIARKKFLRRSIGEVKPLHTANYNFVKQKSDIEKYVPEINGFSRITNLKVIEN